MVVVAPLTVSASSSFEMAVISFDFSATLICPSTKFWPLDQAEIMWVGALARPS